MVSAQLGWAQQGQQVWEESTSGMGFRHNHQASGGLPVGLQQCGLRAGRGQAGPSWQ